MHKCADVVYKNILLGAPANHGVPHTVVSILPGSLDNAGGDTAGRGRTLPGLANHLFYVPEPVPGEDEPCPVLPIIYFT